MRSVGGVVGTDERLFLFRVAFQNGRKKKYLQGMRLQKGIASSVLIGFWHAGEEENGGRGCVAYLPRVIATFLSVSL